MKRLLIFVLALLSTLPITTSANEIENLAYDDNFILYTAIRLAKLSAQSMKLNELPIDIESTTTTTLEILYHRRLISCDGPLDQIAKPLRIVNYPPKGNTSVLTSIADDSRFWPIVMQWYSKNKLGIEFKALDATSGIMDFPACINPHVNVPEFVRKNRQKASH